MTLNYDCDNHEGLLGYLYDESEPAERAAVAAHLAVCTRCSAELAALRATRMDLAAWAPPDAQLGFRIVADSPAAPLAGDGVAADAASGLGAADVASGVSRKVLRPARWWSQPMPAWAQAAAAILIFAAGAGLGALRTTGAAPTGAGNAAAAQSAQAASSAPALSNSSVSDQQLAQLEQRLRNELTGVGVNSGVGAANITAAGVKGVPTLEQVRALIQESEQRQQRELALRTAEVIRDFDTQRRGDLARIEQTFGQMEGNTGVQVEQQRQMLNYLMRVSQRPQ